MTISIKDARKEYNGKLVLEVEELYLGSGGICALMGLNGSGKSTLLQCTSGLESFSSGEVLYNGKKASEVLRKDIAVMMQKPYLFSGSVLDNIKLGLKFRGYKASQINNKLTGYLDYMGIDKLLDKSARRLSGGEQAKAALIRTAVLEARYTFLDEPTASMDIESTVEAEKLIKDMSVKGRTVILVTHDLYQAERLADYIVFLDKGKIIEKGDKHRIFNTPGHKLVKQILRRGGEHDKYGNSDYK